MAHYEELVIDQGSDIAIQISLINQDKTPKDLTSHSITASMRPSYNSPDEDKIDFTTVVTDPATAGEIVLSLTNTQTDSLNSKKRYVFDVEVSFVDENTNTIVERVLEGLIRVTPSVTK